MKYCGKRISAAVLLAAFSLGLSACGRDADQEKQATSAPVKSEMTPVKPEMTPVKPEMTPAKPEVAPMKPGETAKRTRPLPPPPVFLPVKGKILEIQDTGSFVFVSLDCQGKQVWATVPSVDLKVGEEIALDHASMVRKFHAKSLNRTFDELIMAAGVAGKSPRARGNINSKDPRNRRSGMLMAGQPMKPAPALPTPVHSGTEPVAKQDH